MMIQAGLRAISLFIQQIENGFASNAIYRGHADCSWTVRASAFRPGCFGIKTKDQLRRWATMASRFASPKPQNDFEWMVLAQHYGIATPLLDWTTNPLIGLFFACEPTKARGDGCVIRFSPSAFTTYSKPSSIDVFKDDRTKPGLLDSSPMNARTMAQDSAMTIHTVGMPDLTPNEGDVFVIPYSEKYWIRRALRSFGLSAERLYFDLTVAARQFNDEMFITRGKMEP